MSLAGTLARKGAPATLFKSVAGAYDAATDTSTPPSSASVDGFAMEIDGDPDLYSQLGLIESENPTLLFRPKVAGTMPLSVLGFQIVWGGETLTVKNSKRLAMAGTATAARIVVSR